MTRPRFARNYGSGYWMRFAASAISPASWREGSGETRPISLVMIMPDITNPFFPAVVRGVEDVAYKHSLPPGPLQHRQRCPQGELVSERIALLPPGRMAGNSGGGQRDGGAVASLRQLPGLRLSASTDSLRDGRGMWFWWPMKSGAHSATRHLLRMGHRQLAVITGPLHLTNAVERLKGFKRALAEAKVPDRTGVRSGSAV